MSGSTGESKCNIANDSVPKLSPKSGANTMSRLFECIYTEENKKVS